ncbi:4'-phosphopantetheinyl transferase superfamily protein [Arthrobacter sp. B3I4]|uniref:4'-phosphopantetheinyl transferase family protein n=1 Tax=Arthrobacter sp. B3I4 TaxID=3042267 RepID=UPI002787E124|nr:4'-phosphopantetheinyl transferase family protein [Arthrobacter sp. B3I4]MDQ0756881.1 4'-phosphopantetheinyl transferase [Arthrobacter sp. B3I4]
MAAQLILRAVPPFPVPPAAREALDNVELARAHGMAPGPRAAFLAGRVAQRQFAAELLGVPASGLTAAYDCPRCGPGSAHGRPGYSLHGVPAPLLLSLSRSAGWVLLAAVPDPPTGLLLGVDVQDPAGADFDGFDDVALGPAERASLSGLSAAALVSARARLWARKEAWLKLCGTGLRTAPDALDVLHHPGIRDLPPAETGLPARFAAAVALSGMPDGAGRDAYQPGSGGSASS